MPIYEYRCSACGRRSSIFVRSMSSPLSPVCSHCGDAGLSRLISRVAVVRGEDDLAEGMADDSSLADVDERDPRSIARWVRRMSGKVGEPLDAEMEADLERMEAGEMSEEWDGEGGVDEESVLDEA